MKILYFASLKENLKTSHEEIEFKAGTTIKQLKNLLAEKHGKHYFPDNILCAVNQAIALDSLIIKETDEVAFYPPVTGG